MRFPRVAAARIFARSEPPDPLTLVSAIIGVLLATLPTGSRMTVSNRAGGPTVGVLHPGQMGAAVAAAVARGHDVLWCDAGRSPATALRAERSGLRAVPDLATLLALSDVVLSICPPAAAEHIAEQVLEAEPEFAGVLVEANAIAPARMGRIARRLRHRGIRVVDGAIIGPPPTAGRTARLYLAGDSADVQLVLGIVADGPVQAVVLGPTVGAASALKMSFGSYQKASRALAAVAHALADRHGVSDELLAEAGRMPSAVLADRDYIPSVAARAWRWVPEMNEAADALADAGLPPELAQAAAAVLARWEPDRDNWELSVDEALGHLSIRPGPGPESS